MRPPPFMMWTQAVDAGYTAPDPAACVETPGLGAMGVHSANINLAGDLTIECPGITTWTFTGGTGRFASAAGRVDFTGTGSVVTSTTERSFHGRISY